MKKLKSTFFFVVSIIASSITYAQQTTYVDSLRQYQKKYVQEHEVVQGDDRKAMKFFPVSEKYRVMAKVELKQNSNWFTMETSGPLKKIFRIYATASFFIGDTAVQLNIYQSQSLMATEEYRNHLFLPFTDATSGNETYISGRYIDLQTTDLKDGMVLIDFNKAYNPYCAYVSGRYNCPIPPKENRLLVAIRAGEMTYDRPH